MQLLIPLAMLVGVFFFTQWMQKKQQKERKKTLDSMKIGSYIVTIGGLHGILHEFNCDGKTIVLDCEGVYLEFDRTSIRTVKPPLIIEKEKNTKN